MKRPEFCDKPTAGAAVRMGGIKRKAAPGKGRPKQRCDLSDFLLCSAEGAFAHDAIAILAELLLESAPARSVVSVQWFIQVRALLRFRHRIHFVDAGFFQ